MVDNLRVKNSALFACMLGSRSLSSYQLQLWHDPLEDASLRYRTQLAFTSLRISNNGSDKPHDQHKRVQGYLDFGMPLKQQNIRAFLEMSFR